MDEATFTFGQILSVFLLAAPSLAVTVKLQPILGPLVEAVKTPPTPQQGNYKPLMKAIPT